MVRRPPFTVHRSQFQVRCLQSVGDNPRTLQPETVRPKTLQPETVQPETVQPETLERKTIDELTLKQSCLPVMSFLTPDSND